MNHSEKAEALFLEGYNCAQSVLGAFDDLLPFDRETLLRMSSSFGAGYGRMREICGAFSAVCMALGILYTPEGSCDPRKKSEHYRRVQELAGMFLEENGSYFCYELLKIPHKASSPETGERDAQYYRSRPCPGIIARAAAVFDRYLENHPISGLNQNKEESGK